MKADNLGDRMKMYESAETSRRFMPMLPIYARIDGRSFSRFTRGMGRPYDAFMSDAMMRTCMFLVKETHATVGYTQSDEISLVWKNANINSEMFFDGKVFKLTSVLAALATSKFTRIAVDVWPDKAENTPPVFDARVFQLPSLDEATNALLWRVRDAVKNSVSMAAQAFYSAKELHGKNSTDKHQMLVEKGVNWNDYPEYFKEGTFFGRKSVTRPMTYEEMARFPNYVGDGMVTRTEVKSLECSPFHAVINKNEVLYHQSRPIFNTDNPVSI